MNDELQDLDNLTKHPGWHRLTTHGLKEIESRLTAAMANAANGLDDALVASQLRQCIAVKQAIETLLGWPEARFRTLQGQRAGVEEKERTVSFSRRGDL